jgi:adenosylcobinamide kinase / adenosylcobinamide-phosphate guanylyltransferase
MSQKCVLLIGGAGSGKSHRAQELALQQAGPLLFIATAAPGDEEMRQRIAAHRRKRPADWVTLEITSGLGKCILREHGGARVVIVDCITLLVSNILTRHCSPEGEPLDMPLIESEVTSEIGELLDCIQRLEAVFYIVTNEVGLGVVPDNPMGRLYRDLLAGANRRLAAAADEVYLMVAGIPVAVKQRPE